MESRLRVHGQPIQPMLVTLPFGLFVSATVFDLATMVGGPAFLGEVGYWTCVAALVAAALATVAGMVDLWDTPGDRTRRTAIVFNLVNAAMAGLFLLVCLVRAAGPDRTVSGVLFAVELVALAVGAVGVWLGSRLVRRFESVRSDAGFFEPVGGADPTVEFNPHRL
ncbi:DUF2231 domain-containing protein [Micromonospora sp. NPDC000207]|uniref:DUF2231 domain-containing protein n=1 Tax=unclassified Micromonospora TaxID=2617518 RepID=UPI0033253AF6